MGTVPEGQTSVSPYHASVSLLVRALSIGIFGGHRKIYYNAAPSGIQHLFWLGLSAFVLWFFFQPGKDLRPLGGRIGRLFQWTGPATGFAFLAAIVAATIAVSWVIVRLT